MAFGNLKKVVKVFAKHADRKRQAKLNKRQTTQVKRIIGRNEEIKYHTTFYAGQKFGNWDGGVNNYISIIDLSTVAQGQTDSTRIGDQINITSLEMRMQIRQASFGLAGRDETTSRMIIFQYKAQTALTNADIALLLNIGPSEAGAVAEYNSLSVYQHDYTKLFNVLFDHSYAMNDIAGSEKGGLTKVFRVNLKRARKQIRYIAGGTTGIYHIYLCLIGLWPDDKTTATGTVRMFFKDA